MARGHSSGERPVEVSPGKLEASPSPLFFGERTLELKARLAISRPHTLHTFRAPAPDTGQLLAVTWNKHEWQRPLSRSRGNTQQFWRQLVAARSTTAGARQLRIGSECLYPSRSGLFGTSTYSIGDYSRACRRYGRRPQRRKLITDMPSL